MVRESMMQMMLILLSATFMQNIQFQNMGNSSQATHTYKMDQPCTYTHPKLDKATLKQNANKQPIIEAQFPLLNQSQYRKWSRELADNPAIGEEGILSPIGHNYKKIGLCGSSGVAEIIFDNFPFTLKDEIENRQNGLKKYFNETQLWYLLAMITNVGEKFHVVGKKIGDIRPINVFINDDGQIKVVTVYSWPDQPINYEKTYKNREITYLSPQECRDLELGRDKSIANVGIAQAFSIGLTLLDAALLQDGENLYTKDCKFNQEDFFDLRDSFKNKTDYSKELKYIILGLTQTIPERRLSIIQLKNILQPHMGEIMQLQPFLLGDFPQKIKMLMQDHPLQPQKQASIEQKNHIDHNDIAFTFGRDKLNKEQQKTQETTTLMRSRTSNIMKSQSPYRFVVESPVRHSPQHQNAFRMTRPIQVRRQPPNELIYYNRSPPPIQKPPVFHPYYNSNPPESGVLPVYNKISMKQEGKPRINFLYKYKDQMVEQVPSAIKRIEDYGSNKILPSKKSLQGQLHRARGNQLVNAEYYGVTDSIKSDEKSRSRRSSSLKEIEQKIAFSRKMFPY